MRQDLPAFTALLALVLIVSDVSAAGSVRGSVTSKEGKKAASAEVTLVELKRTTKAGPDGTFRFDDVPAGRYIIEVVSPLYGTTLGQVEVANDAESSVALHIDLTVHHQDVVVSAGASPQSVADIAQSVTVLDDRELASKVAPTLGETLAEEPGVSESSYAPGASRPIIRGLGGDRIRILQDGIGVGDASNVSPDHAVSYDPSAAERVEVVRGAATLLYGSNAIGGVVNVLDGRIPDHRTGHAFEGDVTLRHGSSSDLRNGAVNVGGNSGMLGWHIDYAKTQTDDYEAGGDFGVKANSDVDTRNMSAGASWIGDTAYVGAAFNQFETNYGSAVEETVRIDMNQKRWDVRGGINAPFGPFRSLKARLGGTKYEHGELEGGTLGTSFFNDSVEGRVELAHRQAGAWSGSFGVQGWTRDFEAIGDERFIEPVKTKAGALFAYEEVGTGAVKAQLGIRYETQAHDSTDATRQDRDFNAPSASAGLLWTSPRAGYAMGGTLSYSSRIPTTEELYANGPHMATLSFEVGDDTLDLEHGTGLEFVFRKLTGRIDGEVSVFYTRFDDYVFERDTGTTIEIEPGEFLPVFQFSASAARFIGGEAHIDFGLLHAEPHHLDLEVRLDYVRAELTDLDQPVPFQPPLRAALGLKYQGRSFWGSVEGFRVNRQDRFAATDVATPGYTWLNAVIGYRLVAGRLVHDFILRGTNLTDKLAYNSISRFRFDVPLAGRDLGVTYRLAF